MKNILCATAAVIVMAAFTTIPVFSQETGIYETGIEMSSVYFGEMEMSDYILYDENDEADFLALEIEEDENDMICALYDENDEADFALLETEESADALVLYDENDEADFVALENLEIESESELVQNIDEVQETAYLG